MVQTLIRILHILRSIPQKSESGTSYEDQPDEMVSIGSCSTSTGMSTSSTGMSTSSTGMSTSTSTGMLTSSTGMSTSSTGMMTSSTGMSTSSTGMMTSHYKSTGTSTQCCSVGIGTGYVSTSVQVFGYSYYLSKLFAFCTLYFFIYNSY